MSRAAAALVLFAASSALACPVCGTAPEQSSGAYAFMSVVMMFVPVLAIGGIIWWIARSARAQADAAEPARESSQP